MICEFCGKDLGKIVTVLGHDNFEDTNIIIQQHYIAHIKEEAREVVAIFDEVVEKYDDSHVCKLRYLVGLSDTFVSG